MANSADIGNITCKTCGVVYCRFISKGCPVCKLSNNKDMDFLLQKTLEENKSRGWNGDV